jgi:hypothetical protein
MIRRIQGEGDISFVIYPFRNDDGVVVVTSVRYIDVLGLVSSSLACTRYIFIEPFFCNLRMSNDPVVVFLP